MTDTNKEENEEPVRWGLDVLDNSQAAFRRVWDVLNLGKAGTHDRSYSVRVVETLRRSAYRSDTEEIYGKRLASAHHFEMLAKSEIENDFPMLHAQALVALWGVLEAFVEDFLIAWIVNGEYSLALFHDKDTKISVEIRDYILDDKHERARFLLEAMMERNRNLHLIKRYEEVQRALNMTGNLPGGIERDLTEMYQMRNAIVHRGSVVDRHLLRVCSWLSLALGSPVMIGTMNIERYADAASRYMFRVFSRVLPHYGGEYDPDTGKVHFIDTDDMANNDLSSKPVEGDYQSTADANEHPEPRNEI